VEIWDLEINLEVRKSFDGIKWNCVYVKQIHDYSGIELTVFSVSIS